MICHSRLKFFPLQLNWASALLMLLVSIAGAQEGIGELEASNPDEVFEAKDKFKPIVRNLTQEEKSNLVKAEVKVALEKKKEEDQFKKMAPSGVIASVGGGVGSQSVGMIGDLSTTKDDQPPLSASVAKENNGWKVNITNSSKKHVSATIQVEQYAKGASPVKTDNLSVSLPGSVAVSRSVSSGPGTLNVQVKVVSWKVS
jgi:hypothetical protein